MPSHKSLAERRAYHREYMRRRYQTDHEHREKQKARSQVGHALRDGKLEKRQCASCGDLFVEAHHEDYGKPFDVQWFCRSCHEAIHGGPGCHGKHGVEKQTSRKPHKLEIAGANPAPVTLQLLT